MKIYNLYTGMAYITVYDKCIQISEAYMNGKPGGKKKTATQDDVVVNMADVNSLVERAGVDLDIVKKEAFPQLKFENKSVIESMF